jgi:hypothetical protein
LLTNLVVRLSERGCAILLLAASLTEPADWPWEPLASPHEGWGLAYLAVA